MNNQAPIGRNRWTKLAPKIVVFALAAVFVERSAEWAMDAAFEERGTTIAVEPASDRSPAAVSRGQLLYQVHCLRCHGPEGRGDGSDSANLRPPPRDLAMTIGDWSREKVGQSIIEGKRNTAMPAFGETFPRRELDAMVAYVRSFRREDPGGNDRPDPSALAEPLRRRGSCRSRTRGPRRS